MNTQLQVPSVSSVVPTHDEAVLKLWSYRASEHTTRAYLHDAQAFLIWAGKGLQAITLGDLQDYAQHLEGTDIAPATIARHLNSIKSLLTFAHKLGYLQVNVGTAFIMPTQKDTLAQRIMSEEETIRLISLESNPRNHCILRLLYHCGLRVSEIVSLTWGDVTERSGGQAQVTVFGKGRKTRQIVISASMYEELKAVGGLFQSLDTPVFRSRKGGGPLETRQVDRIVKEAAKRANVRAGVSPHWLRHAHASHSLDRGAPINLVRETLGHANLATTGKYTHARPHESSSKYLPL